MSVCRLVYPCVLVFTTTTPVPLDHADNQTKHSTCYAQRCRTDGIQLQRRRRLVGSQDGAARLLSFRSRYIFTYYQLHHLLCPINISRPSSLPITLYPTSRLILINSRYSLFASIFTLVQAVSPNESDSDPMDTFSRFSNLYFTS